MALTPIPHHGAPGDVSSVALKTVITEYTKMISELAHLTADLPQRLQMAHLMADLPQPLQMVDTDHRTVSEPHLPIVGLRLGTSPVPPKADEQIQENGEDEDDDDHSVGISDSVQMSHAPSQGTMPPTIRDRSELDKRIREFLSDGPVNRRSVNRSDRYQILTACCPYFFRERHARGSIEEQMVEDEEQSASSRSGKLTLLGAAPPSDGHATFDIMMGLVILANSLVLLIQLEYTGSKSAASLGNHDGISWPSLQTWFDVSDHVFNAFFVLEMVFRFVVFKTRLTDDPSLLFDLLVVLCSSVKLYVLDVVNAHSLLANVSVLRMVRFLRVVRALRLVRTLKLFSDLRVLVKTIIHSFSALLWSMVLLFLIMIMGGLLLCEMLTEYIQDPTQNLSMRKWAFKYYGTSTRAIYTLFEVTMAGCWPNYFRPLIHEVSGWFLLFVVSYVSLVVFAIIRIITAIFLKETLHIAGHDAEMMAHERAKQKQRYIKKLRLLFEAVDASGNGTLNLEDFQAMANNPRVASWFQTLDIEIHDAEAVFGLLDDGDGEVTFDTFLKGLTRVKGQARAMDVVTIMNASDETMRSLGLMKDALSDLLERADLPRLETRFERKLGVSGDEHGRRQDCRIVSFNDSQEISEARKPAISERPVANKFTV